jgi:hypothetical protein
LKKTRFWQKLKAVKAKQVLLGGSIVILALLLYAFRHYLLLLGFLTVNVISSALLKVVRRNQIGIELVMFSTVMSGVIYGPVYGAVMGAVSMIIDYAFATRLSFFSIITVPSYAAVGYIAGLIGGSVGITPLGIMLTVIYVVVSNALIVGLMGGTLSKSLRFAATDIAFNAVLFSAVAPYVLDMVG